MIINRSRRRQKNSDWDAVGTVQEILNKPDIPDSVVLSGVYTPTVTPGLNVTSATPNVFNYYRVGNAVHLSGRITIVPVDQDTPVTFTVTLPIFSDFTHVQDASGIGISNACVGYMTPTTATNLLHFVCADVPTVPGNIIMHIRATYIIK